MADKVYVVDTNIILQNLHYLFRLSEEGKNIVVVPETVLVEVEEKKKLFTDIGFQAREFARFLAEAKVKEVDYYETFKVVKMRRNDMVIHLISKEQYKTHIEISSLAESNDKRIIEVAKIAKEYYKGQKVIFLSIDVYARIFALFENIKTESLRDDKSEVPKLQFFKRLELDSTLFNSINYKLIKEYDEHYVPNNFCYEFVSPDDGNRTYGIIHQGKILLLNDGDFNGIKVKPINLHQKFLMKAILSNLYNVITVDAKAGSGKTLLSITGAMKLIDQGHYDKIVYVRNSIESLDKGADVGYLAGNDEKFRIYNMALYDTLEFIAKRKLKKSENKNNLESIKSKIDELIKLYQIEKLWPGEARGRTLSGSIVILDEWQNSSDSTTQLILSRLDDSCMAVVIGSNRQIDNLYLNKFNNGLTSLLKQTKNEHDELSMFAVELESSVRGKYAQFSERVFEK